MNDFCSQKGIKREFRNARTPQQNGVAKRRNRTLIEAARTMLADAKLPAIEKGAGLNWLFDIDSLTKSINYVPVDAVKKDVSSLRYIALPNWVHDALLESSSSKPQDDCSTDVPESSGNSNPTTTSTNPPVDQLETLIVDSIPTVSSPVPTACLNDSSEPSIDSDRVKTDVSNMETTITTSPTPTLKIHKDHPKSQIIGPVDTLIQTRNKSKEDERGIVIRNKARLVAQGHTQEEWIDYGEVFIPVARIEAIRLFLAYASFKGFTVYLMDVKSAYLYGTIDEEVYVMQHSGFQDPEFLVKLYKVEKAIEYEALMLENFQMSAMGELNFFLGLQVLQKEDDIFLSQDKYVGDILKKFGYSNVRSSNTPMDKENP
nr:hypothetical protein [Tanacetum cinerariifolium]